MMPEHKAAGWKTPIWDTYKSIIVAANGETQFEEVERFAFYERSKRAFCVVATGETALYGNLILKKGPCSCAWRGAFEWRLRCLLRWTHSLLFLPPHLRYMQASLAATESRSARQSSTEQRKKTVYCISPASLSCPCATTSRAAQQRAQQEFCPACSPPCSGSGRPRGAQKLRQ